MFNILAATLAFIKVKVAVLLFYYELALISLLKILKGGL